MKIYPIINLNNTIIFTPLRQENKNITNNFKKEYNPIVYPKSYYLINCSFKGKTFAEKFEEHLKTDSEDELYMFFDEELRKSAAKKMLPLDVVDDVVQEGLINILLSLNEFKNGNKTQDECILEVCEIRDKLKPAQVDLPTRNGVKSIYSTTKDTDALHLIDTLTEDSKIRYYSNYRTDEQIKKAKKKLEKALEKAKLSQRSRDILIDRYINGMEYPQIADKYKINEKTAQKSVKSSLLKIQRMNHVLPKSILDNINALSNTLGTDIGTTENMVFLNPYILGHPLEKYKEHIEYMLREFKEEGLTKEEYVKTCVKFPELLSKKPETLAQNITTTTEKLSVYGLERKRFLYAALKQPSLFSIRPEKIYDNITSTADTFKKYGLNRNTYVKNACSHPPLFSISSDIINRNIKNTVNMFANKGLTEKKYVEACIKYPSLFTTKAENINKNINEMVKRFNEYGLTEDKFIKSCIKTPSLFYQSADTIENNIKAIVEEYENDGLTMEKYIQAALKHSTLFTLSPKTTKEKIDSVVNLFEPNGLTRELYIKAALKQPQLFYQLPDTIEKNIKELVKIYENDGLTVDEYLRAAILQPPLFCMKPETVENNINGVSNWLAKFGITKEKYIKAGIKCPSLFESKPETIIEHINIKRFVLFNKYEDYNDKETIEKVLSSPVSLNYSTKLNLIQHLIIPQMFKNMHKRKWLGKRNLEVNLEQYLKDNPDKTYTLEVKKFDCETDCIKLLSEYLKELTQKTLNNENVYTIKLIS